MTKWYRHRGREPTSRIVKPAASPLIDLLDDEVDTTLLILHPPLAPSILVKDDKLPNGGTHQHSTLPIPLPAPCTQETKGPRQNPADNVMPQELNHNGTPQEAEEDPTHRRRRDVQHHNNDENPWKRLIAQIAACTSMLPHFQKYQRCPRPLKTRPLKMPNLDQKPSTTDKAKDSTYDVVLQHLKFCYHPQAKEQEHPLNPFPLTTRRHAVLTHQKHYQPINAPKTDET
ncbi:hypothetical protein EDB92DRAFT_1812851 [Lactarius akahatsu]|uniref:Uncharacterized protein n=1 Tax=Lactarius akahatsu TaxID=416441 RepID=A0AAD4LRI3_9AGAM|nr:hypothetical protein EDB92DRAFT_1812851 [Lactarius akahatsu]